MNFTVVRSVRGSDTTVVRPLDKEAGALRATPPPPAPMDLPFADVVLHLDDAGVVDTAPDAPR